MYPGTGVLGVKGEQVYLNCHYRTMYTHCCSRVVSYTGLNFMQSGWSNGSPEPNVYVYAGLSKICGDINGKYCYVQKVSETYCKKY